MSATDLLAALPFLLLAGGGLGIALVSSFARADDRAWPFLGALLAAAASVAAGLPGGGPSGLGGALHRDGASTLFTVLAAAAASVALLLAIDERAARRVGSAETVAHVLFAASGAALLGASGDLVLVFVGLALLAVPAYLVSASRTGPRGSRRDVLLVGRAAAGPVVGGAGAALVYLSEGSFRIGSLALVSGTVGLVGVALVLAGLAFAAIVVPLEVTARRVPASAVAAMSVAAEVGTFAALLRLGGVVTTSGDAAIDLRAAAAVLSAAALVIASLVALAEASLRRIIAFSTIAQAGYLALALASGAAGSAAASFSIVLFATVALGALAFVGWLGGDDPRRDELRGLARHRPFVVVALGIVLLGLAGLPPTGGFIARLYLLESAMGARLAWLAFIAAFASVVAAAYCLRVLFACFGEQTAPRSRRSSVSAGVLVLSAMAVLLLGIVPGPLLDAAANVRF